MAPVFHLSEVYFEELTELTDQFLCFLENADLKTYTNFV